MYESAGTAARHGSVDAIPQWSRRPEIRHQMILSPGDIASVPVHD